MDTRDRGSYKSQKEIFDEKENFNEQYNSLKKDGPAVIQSTDAETAFNFAAKEIEQVKLLKEKIDTQQEKYAQYKEELEKNLKDLNELLNTDEIKKDASLKNQVETLARQLTISLNEAEKIQKNIDQEITDFKKELIPVYLEYCNNEAKIAFIKKTIAMGLYAAAYDYFENKRKNGLTKEEEVPRFFPIEMFPGLYPNNDPNKKVTLENMPSYEESYQQLETQSFNKLEESANSIAISCDTGTKSGSSDKLKKIDARFTEIKAIISQFIFIQSLQGQDLFQFNKGSTGNPPTFSWDQKEDSGLIAFEKKHTDKKEINLLKTDQVKLRYDSKTLSEKEKENGIEEPPLQMNNRAFLEMEEPEINATQQKLDNFFSSFKRELTLEKTILEKSLSATQTSLQTLQVKIEENKKMLAEIALLEAAIEQEKQNTKKTNEKIEKEKKELEELLKSNEIEEDFKLESGIGFGLWEASFSLSEDPLPQAEEFNPENEASNETKLANLKIELEAWKIHQKELNGLLAEITNIKLTLIIHKTENEIKIIQENIQNKVDEINPLLPFIFPEETKNKTSERIKEIIKDKNSPLPEPTEIKKKWMKMIGRKAILINHETELKKLDEILEKALKRKKIIEEFNQKKEGINQSIPQWHTQVEEWDAQEPSFIDKVLTSQATLAKHRIDYAANSGLLATKLQHTEDKLKELSDDRIESEIEEINASYEELQKTYEALQKAHPGSRGNSPKNASESRKDKSKNESPASSPSPGTSPVGSPSKEGQTVEKILHEFEQNNPPPSPNTAPVSANILAGHIEPIEVAAEPLPANVENPIQQQLLKQQLLGYVLNPVVPPPIDENKKSGMEELLKSAVDGIGTYLERNGSHLSRFNRFFDGERGKTRAEFYRNMIANFNGMNPLARLAFLYALLSNKGGKTLKQAVLTKIGQDAAFGTDLIMQNLGVFLKTNLSDPSKLPALNKLIGKIVVSVNNEEMPSKRVFKELDRELFVDTFNPPARKLIKQNLEYIFYPNPVIQTDENKKSGIEALLDVSLCGITRYLEREGSHLSGFKRFFDGDKGTRRAEYYQKMLDTSNNKTNNPLVRLTFLYALLVSSDGKTLQKDVLNEINGYVSPSLTMKDIKKKLGDFLGENLKDINTKGKSYKQSMQDDLKKQIGIIVSSINNKKPLDEASMLEKLNRLFVDKFNQNPQQPQQEQAAQPWNQ